MEIGVAQSVSLPVAAFAASRSALVSLSRTPDVKAETQGSKGQVVGAFAVDGCPGSARWRWLAIRVGLPGLERGRQFLRDQGGLRPSFLLRVGGRV